MAGLAWPYEEDLDFLASSGINCLINLTEYESTFEEAAAAMGIRIHNIEIQEFCPPTPVQIEEFIAICTEEDNVSSSCTLTSFKFVIGCYKIHIKLPMRYIDHRRNAEYFGC